MSNRFRLNLYAPIEPYATGRLAVTDGHELYFEESGNRDGIPVVVLHGGPGGAANPTMRRLHDPERWRIVLFDQRGCGRSTPYASLDANTTWDLVADIERLRRHLGIERWHVVGGSWGSTLALAYAETHPASVSSLLLRGIFLLRNSELDWFYQNGCNWLFPDAYADFVAPIPPAERHDMIRAYHARLVGDDTEVQLRAARAWSTYEGTTLSLVQDPERVRQFASDRYALAFARIECHYFVNRGFFDRDGQLLQNIDRIRHLPTTVVQGRYDVVTPMRSAWDLKAAWPEADLRIVPDAGHAVTEPGIIDELVAATRRLATLR